MQISIGKVLGVFLVLGMMMLEGVKGAVCDSNPCLNNGVCVDQGASYSCTCYTGTSGPNCETASGAPSPCFSAAFKSVTYDKATATTTYCYDVTVENHALCLQTSITILSDCLNNFSASQSDGAVISNRGPMWSGTFINYSATRCFTLDNIVNVDPFGLSDPLDQSSATGNGLAPYCQADGCSPDLCLNDATCLDQLAGYLCACPSGFEGSQCEINIDDCSLSDCVNGVCVDGPNSYTCSCDPGYTGDKCDANINECASNPCYYGSTCVDGLNGVTCLCKAGYEGPLCQTEINECAGDPCLNGATCVDQINRYVCQCPAGYTGTNCGSLLPGNCGSVSLKSSCYDSLTDTSTICLTVQTFSDASCTFSKFTVWSDCPNTFYATPPGASYFNNFGARGVTWTFPGSANSAYDFCLEYPGEVSIVGSPSLVKFSGGDMIVSSITPFCETNECLNSPCQNGGTCIDSVNTFVCDCPTGFRGSRCQSAF